MFQPRSSSNVYTVTSDATVVKTKISGIRKAHLDGGFEPQRTNRESLLLWDSRLVRQIRISKPKGGKYSIYEKDIDKQNMIF